MNERETKQEIKFLLKPLHMSQNLNLCQL